MKAIDVRDGYCRELSIRYIRQAAYVDSVHLADRRFVSDAKRSHSAVPAEVVLVLPGIEQVPRQIRLACQQAKVIRLGDCRPEARPSADRAVAAKSGLSQIEVGLKSDCATMTTAAVGFQH
jgi:hypothetical protein